MDKTIKHPTKPTAVHQRTNLGFTRTNSETMQDRINLRVQQTRESKKRKPSMPKMPWEDK